jgi:TP901 family phage tail tape measure protein
VSDVNANIGIQINAAPALAELKNLQRQLANFHSQVAKGSAASAAAQKNLQTNLLNSINATGKFTAQMGLVRTSTESFTHALENNKLSMGQYFKYAGASTKSFGKLFKSEFDTIGKVAEDRVKKMQTQYIKMGRDAQGAMKSMAITPTTLNMKDTATQTALAAQKQALFNQLVKQGSTNLLNFGKNTQWAGRQLMVGFTIPLTYFGTIAGKTFMDLEAQAIRFKRVYGDIFTTSEETNKALADIQNLAKEFTKYGVAVTDTMKMAADAAATGKSGADLTAQVAEATRLAVLGGVEQEQALETTISLTNAFGIAAQDLKKDIDFLNAVENQTVTNIEDLTIAIPKAGPVVKQLGGNVQDLAFFLTAMKEGGINASEGANALKSGLASLINPSEKASKMLAGLGINIKGIVQGNAGNLKETVIDFSQALDTLAPLDRARAIEQLFGKFQFARLSTLFQNVTKDGTQASRVLSLTGKSVEELAILSERELKTVEDAVGTNFRASIEKLKISIAPIGKTFLEAITPIIKVVGNLLEKFNNLGDGTKKFLVVATTLVGAVGPVLLMTFGLLANGLANIVKLFLSLRTGFLRMTGDSKNLGQTTDYLTQQQLEAETVAASLNQAHSRLTQQFELEASAVMALRKAYIDATVAAANFARANPGMMSPRGGKTPKKFNAGTSRVPGYKKGTDSVPAMLTPGEAVIPADAAQDPANKPFIQALIDGSIRKYSIGTANAGEQYSHVGKSKYVSIEKLLSQPGISELDKQKLSTYRDILKATGLPEQISTRHNLAYSFPGSDNRRMAGAGLPIADWESKWIKGGAAKWISSNIPASQAKIVDDALLAKVRDMGVGTVNDDVIEKAFKELPDSVKKTSTYKQMENLYSKVGEYTIGKGLGDTPATTKAVLEQAKAQGLIKDYEVRERFSKSKGKVVNSGITITTKDGTRVDLGRGSSGQRNPLKDTQSTRRGGKTVAARTGEYIVDPKTGKVTKITEQNTKPKSAGVGTTTRAIKDNRVLRIGRGKMILPGAETGLDANGNPLPAVKAGVKNIPFSSAVDQTRIKQSSFKQIDAVEKNIAATEESTKATNKFAGKMTAGLNVFAGLTMAASFLGGSMGDMAQKIMPFTILLSTLAMLGPSLKSGFTKLGAFLLANPWSMLVAGVIALVTSIKLMKDKNEKQAKAQSDYIEAISTSTEKMKKVGEITGKVGAAEIMARRREGGTTDKFTTGYDRVGQQFGTNFLSSDIGKSIYDTFKTNLSKGGTDAVKNIALELSTYVSDGLMTAEDANSVARSIGINMSDMTIAANIRGELTSLLGPDGQNLLKDPLNVRINIGKQQTKIASEALASLQNAGNIELQSQLGASVSAAYTQSLEVIQAQRDAQSKMYDDQIRALETQLATTKDKQKQLELETQIANLTDKKNSDDTKFGVQRQNLIKDQLKAFKYTESKGGFLQLNQTQNAFMKSGKEQVKSKYKGTSQEPFINEFLTKSAGTGGRLTSQIEVVLNTMVGAGDLTPMAGTKLLNMFGKGGEAKLQTILTTTFATQDPGKVAELINLASNIKGAGGKELGLKILTEIGAPGQEAKFDDRLNALSLLQKMDQKEINLGVFLQGDAVGKLDKLVPLLNKVEKQKTINKKVLLDLQKTEGMPDMQGLIDDWEHYKNLDPEVQKTVTQTYISVFKTIGQKEAAQFISDKIAKAGGQNLPDIAKAGITAPYLNSDGTYNLPEVAASLTKQQFAAGKEKNTIPGGGGGGGGTGNRDTTLDSILNRLKMVRDASINAIGGVKELTKISSGSGITKFSGVINQLMTGSDATAKNRGFISFIESMDEATRKTYMTIKNGRVVLTQQGKDLAEAFNEQTLGDFNLVQKDTITQVQAQKSAFIKLKSAGVDTSTALEMVADAELAISINSSVEPANKLKAMATNALEAKNAVEQLNLAFKQSMATSVQELEMLSQLPNLVDQMNALGMNSDQVQAVLSNPDFAREMINNLKDGKVISKDLVDYINSIPARKTLQFNIDMKTPEGMQNIFDKAFGNATEYFNTLEAAIQLKFKKPIKEAETAVKDAQDAVDKIQKTIDSFQEDISKKERQIEINFTRPIELLQSESSILSHDLSLMDRVADGITKRYDEQANALNKVAEINSEIAVQQKQQLTLADALTSGDISAAAAAAQDMRSTQAANQINKTQEALQVAKDLEIANLRNVAGLTREQIEKRQFDISEQVYALENKKALVELEIRGIQDKIYNIENGIGVAKDNNLKLANENLEAAQANLVIKQDELTAELDAIEAQRDKWIQAQSAIDLARVKSEAFGESIKLNTSLVENLAAAWSSVKPPSTVTGNVKVDPAALKASQDKYDSELKSASSLKGVPGMETVYKSMLSAFNAKYPNGRPMNTGGFVPGRGMTDKVSTLLTPGEFVMNKAGAKAFGPMLSQINSSKYPSMLSPSNLATPTYGDMSSVVISPSNISTTSSVNNSMSSVYNYSVGITVNGSNSTADDIARVVMTQIKNVDSQRIRGQRA